MTSLRDELTSLLDKYSSVEASSELNKVLLSFIDQAVKRFDLMYDDDDDYSSSATVVDHIAHGGFEFKDVFRSDVIGSPNTEIRMRTCKSCGYSTSVHVYKNTPYTGKIVITRNGVEVTPAVDAVIENHCTPVKLPNSMPNWPKCNSCGRNMGSWTRYTINPIQGLDENSSKIVYRCNYCDIRPKRRDEDLYP